MRVIKSKLTGVSFDNRQQNIVLVQPGFRLFWKHEKDNQYDANAIRVFADPQFRVDLGHLNRRLAADFVTRIGEGTSQELFCAQITGGKEGKHYGMNVKLVIKP